MKNQLQFVKRNSIYLLAIVIPFLCLVGCQSKSAEMAAYATIKQMSFRPVSKTDPMLGTRYTHPKVGYSIRPPAGWLLQPSVAKDDLHYRYPIAFKARLLSDFLEIGLVDSGIKDVNGYSLHVLASSYANALSRGNVIKILGTDVFQYNGIKIVQIMSERGNVVILQLLMFKDSSQFVQLTYGLATSRYQLMARAIEASIASFTWNEKSKVVTPAR